MSGLVGWLDVVDEVNDVMSAETQETQEGVIDAILPPHEPVRFALLPIANEHYQNHNSTLSLFIPDHLKPKSLI